MLEEMNVINSMGGGTVPVENLEIQRFSMSGIGRTYTCTFSNKIKLIFSGLLSSNGIYSVYKVEEDGTLVQLTYGSGGSLIPTLSNEKTVVITSSWSASNPYIVMALTTDNLDEIDFTCE